MAGASPTNERKRVKVYELRDNDWFDRGTGFCTANSIRENERITVESEENPERLLLDFQIKREDAYQKQQDTLIVWTDPGGLDHPNGVDMALSFQEAEGCSIVWTAINEVQAAISECQEDGLHASLTLPSANLGNLAHIEEVVRRANATQSGRDTLSKTIIQENYIASLTPLVEVAEDLESLQDLHRLCNIMKTLILFNDTPIVEYVVSSEIILGVVGALEYDPDFPNHKANHRQYLSDPTKFKEVVHIEDPEIRKKIHSVYRLQYLKDVVLARILDDPTFSVLNSLIFFLQVDIVQHIQSNTSFLTELFGILTSADAEPQKKKDAVLFIQQSCAISKSLQAPTRAQLYSNFISCGLFPTIIYALQHQDPSIRVAGTDILVAVIDHDAVMMRTFIAKSITEKSKPMLDNLVELLLVETDLGVKAQIADALKVLLDPGTNGAMMDRTVGQDGNSFLAKMRGNAAMIAQTDGFLQYFYDVSAKTLFTPLRNLEFRESLDNLSFHEVSTFSHLVEILCFFVRQHNFRSKYFILSEGMHSRVAQLMSCPEKHLKLVAIKYIRTCIGIQDEFHTRQIMQHRLLGPVLNLIITTMPRDNLLNSACLELFEYIRRESLKPLILHLVEVYREQLMSITYVDVFHGILRRHEQLTNPPPPQETQNREEGADSSFMTSEADTPNTRHITINGGATRWGQSLKDPDAEEDTYFNTSDGEEDDDDELGRDEPSTLPGGLTNGLRASPMKPLVEYGDDEDDDLALRTDGDTPMNDGTIPRKNSDESTTSSERSNPVLTPVSTPSPPTSLPEKRPREDDDDDDDELGKLSAGIKRRTSERHRRTNSSEPIDLGKENDKGNKDEASTTDSDVSNPPQRHSLRRTRSSNSTKDSSNKAGTGRKIAISLSSATTAAASKKVDDNAKDDT